MPRPFQIDPSVGIVYHKSFGFPSGAAQTATIIAGVAYARCSRYLIKILSTLFALTLCFSRIFLGLHFFTDILGGIAVGFLLVIIYLKVFPLIKKSWDIFALGLSILLFLLGGVKMLPKVGMLLGIAAGLRFSKQTQVPTSWTARLITLFFVIAGTFLLIYVGKTYRSIKPFTTCLAGFWFTHLGNFLALKAHAFANRLDKNDLN